MPLYKYNGRNLKGEKVKGKQESPDKDALYQMLKEDGIFAYSMVEIDDVKKTTPLKSKELTEFAQQLGTMLSSGMSLTRTLHIIVQRAGKPALKDLFLAIHNEVTHGTLLSDALAHQGRAFPPLMINMVRAGEASGTMEVVANKLALHYEKDMKLQSKVKSAMIYPCIVLVMIIAVIMIIFTWVMPKLFKVFESAGNLPKMTRVIMGMSTFVKTHVVLTIVMIMLFFAVCAFIWTLPKVTFWRHKVIFKVPLIGKIFCTIYTARFARGLSSMYSSGLSMVESVNIACSLLNNQYMATKFPNAIVQIRNGVPLSTVIRDMEGFDSKLASSIFVGEESGRINEILEKLADNYDYEADQATSRLLTFIEPLMVIVMALIVGTVMISVLVPIYQYYQTIGG